MYFWVTCNVNFELLGWADVYAGYSCGGLVGMGGVPVFHSHSFCLEVYLLSTVWYVTHPCYYNFFVGYEPGFLLYLVYSSFPRLLGDLWGSCFYLRRLSSPTYDLFLFYKQVHLRLEFFFYINCHTLEAGTRDNQVLGYKVSR